MRRPELAQLIAKFGATTRLTDAIQRLNQRNPADFSKTLVEQDAAAMVIFSGDIITPKEIS